MIFFLVLGDVICCTAMMQNYYGLSRAFSLVRGYAYAARHFLKLSLSSRLPPVLVKSTVYSHSHQLRPCLFQNNRHHFQRHFHSACSRPFFAYHLKAVNVARFGLRCFSSLREMKCPKPPSLFSPNYCYNYIRRPNTLSLSRNISTATVSFLSRERHSLFKLFGNSNPKAAFQNSTRDQILKNLSKKFLHSKGQFSTPVETLKKNWKSQNFRYRSARYRPTNVPDFLYPSPTIEERLYLNNPSNSRRHFSISSSLPSLSELTRVFHPTPETGSYVDFDMTPTITVPSVTQLSSDVVDQVTQDIERHIKELQTMVSNFKKLASLGELPLSVEDGSLRVYFPNCDSEQVHSLLMNAEVTQGVVGTHGDVSPIDSSSESSYYINSCSVSTNPSSIDVIEASSMEQSQNSGSSFYYADMDSVSRRNSVVSSTGSWEIAHIRGFDNRSVESSVPLPPSLTLASSYDTVSEASSF